MSDQQGTDAPVDDLTFVINYVRNVLREYQRSGVDTTSKTVCVLSPTLTLEDALAVRTAFRGRIKVVLCVKV